MRIFLFELVLAGGFRHAAGATPAGLLAEASAMVAALGEDFARAGHQVSLLVADVSFPAPPGCERVSLREGECCRDAFLRLAAQADRTLLIAPELDGLLSDYCRQAEATGVRLLGPSLELVELAADKHRLAEHLCERGVPTPRGVSLEPGARLPRDFAYPAVLKPRDGAGSQQIRLLPHAPQRGGEAEGLDRPARLERYHAGLPASVALLCGPAGIVALPAVQQLLADDGTFAYRGGRLPLDSALDQRARALAAAAIAQLPAPRGYVGVDLVLSHLPDQADVVIEINPRLTTSYVGLRHLVRENLAEAMLQMSEGGALPPLSYRTTGVQFDANGHIQLIP